MNHINEIRKKLEKNIVFLKCIEKARKSDYFDIVSNTMEKWNFDSDINHPNGHYDVEGHKWIDIFLKYNYNLLNPKDLFHYLKNIFLNHSFKLNLTKWSFVINSFDIMKHDLANEKAESLVPLNLTSSIFSENKDGRIVIDSKNNEELIDDYTIEYLKQYNKIQKSELIRYIYEDYFKLSDEIYIGINDPTLIVADEDYIKFDLKDGWSNKKICYIIQKYLFALSYYYIVRIKNDDI